MSSVETHSLGWVFCFVTGGCGVSSLVLEATLESKLTLNVLGSWDDLEFMIFFVCFLSVGIKSGPLFLVFHMALSVLG